MAYRKSSSIGGLVVKSVVAIDGPRVRFPADAVVFCQFFVPHREFEIYVTYIVILTASDRR